MRISLENRHVFLKEFSGFERLIPLRDKEALSKCELSGSFVRIANLAKKYIKRLAKYRENTSLLEGSHYPGGRLMSIERFMQDPWLSRGRLLTNHMTEQRENLFFHYLEISEEMGKEKPLSFLLDALEGYFKALLVRSATSAERHFEDVFFSALVGVYLVSFFELLMDWFYSDPDDEDFEEEEW